MTTYQHNSPRTINNRDRLPVPQGSPRAVNQRPRPAVPIGRPGAITNRNQFIQSAQTPQAFSTQPATGPTGITLEEVMRMEGLQDQALNRAIAAIQAQHAATAAGISSAQAGIGIDRERLQYGLDASIRDIGQAVEAGLEGSAANAAQRGILGSGIQQETQEEVRREGDEAVKDTRAEFGFAMRELSNRAAGLRSQMSALNQMRQAQIAGAITSSDIEYNAWLQPLLPGADYSDPLAQQSRQQQTTQRGGSPGAYGAGA